MNKFYDIKKEGDKTFIEIVASRLPSLFKYQSVNDYSVQALLEHKIYGTTPSSFNDAYDTMFCYRESFLIKRIIELIPEERMKLYLKFFDVNTPKEVAKKILEEVVVSLYKEFKMNYVVSCFSEDLFNDVMWGQYANRSSGFVLEYDGYELFNAARATNEIYYYIREKKGFINLNKKKHVSIMPILYDNQKANCEEFICNSLERVFEYYDDECSRNNNYLLQNTKYHLPISVFNPNQEELEQLFYNSICRKKKSWSYEKEWRIWSYNISSIYGIPDTYSEICVNIKPKAIYLGENMSQFNRIAICAIAKEIQVPVYKMSTKMTKTKCKLIKQLIQPI